MNSLFLYVSFDLDVTRINKVWNEHDDEETFCISNAGEKEERS